MSGVFDSISTGILIYMALVDLIAVDFTSSRFRADGRLQMAGYGALVLGAGFVFGFWRGLLAVWLGGGVGQAGAFLLARYLLRDCVAGLLAGKKFIPEGSGTLKTDTGTFGLLVFAVKIIIAALAFFPALALGPIAEWMQQI